MFIVTHRKIFYTFSTLLIAASIFSMFYFGFRFGIDFKGGSLTEVSYPNGRPQLDNVRVEVEKLNLGEFVLQPAGDSNFIIRTKELDQQGKASLEKAMSLDGKSEIKEERFNTIGPIVGKELRTKSLIAIAIVVLGIMLYITFVFRKVSYPVSSWKFGLATVIALAHDVIVPTGAYIIYGRFVNAEIDLLFVSAILAILGYSVHDTIVVFDRIRENLRIHDYRKQNFDATVGESVFQTMGRSINTSLTIFFVLLVLYFIGGETTKNFSFLLLIGIVIGTYSSIFIASPLLVTFNKWQEKRKLAK